MALVGAFTHVPLHGGTHVPLHGAKHPSMLDSWNLYGSRWSIHPYLFDDQSYGAKQLHFDKSLWLSLEHSPMFLFMGQASIHVTLMEFRSNTHPCVPSWGYLHPCPVMGVPSPMPCHGVTFTQTKHLPMSSFPSFRSIHGSNMSASCWRALRLGPE
jgi:hypothetical protein